MAINAEEREVRAYLEALASTGRDGFSKYRRAEGVPASDKGAMELVLRRFRALPLLLDPGLHALSFRALGACMGAPANASTPFSSMLWKGGARDTHRGFRLKGTLGDFVEHILIGRSHEIAPKRAGWVVTPTSNSDGWRGNSSVVTMHGLSLDCDNSGPWDILLAELGRLGLAHVAYQSGGWTPRTHKWHLLLPLDRPFQVDSENGASRWKSAYRAARVVLGSIGRLSGDGFDPTTDAPAVPVFVTERRDKADSERVVVFKPGRALDLEALLDALPAPPAVAEDKGERNRREATSRSMDDDKLEDLVAALAKVTASVPSGRRELYLALPGALLDRGLDPDDVIAVCEEVSARYPRPDETIHADNVRAARTTVTKWEADAPVTRIGTLQATWPEVARVLDEHLPDETLEELRQTFDRLASKTRSAVAVGEDVQAASSTATDAGRSSGAVGADLPSLRERLRQMRSKRKREGTPEGVVKAWILDRVLRGEGFVPYVEGTGAAVVLRGKVVDRTEAVRLAMGMIAFGLPVGTPFRAVKEVVRESLSKMIDAEAGDTAALFEQAERDFIKALGNRVERDEERARDTADKKEFARQHALRGGVL